jgi:hypothetical protein
MKRCCNTTNRTKKCRRKDSKLFLLPRKYSKKQCLTKQKGYSMKSSCAPYKFCKKKKFLFNPKNPKLSFDVYIDKNPKDTIPIKYSSVDDVKHTIKKLERLYKKKKYSHKRIWQVGMIMKVRLESMNKRKKTIKTRNIGKRYNLSKRYYTFLGKRTKQKGFENRKKMVFKV